MYTIVSPANATVRGEVHEHKANKERKCRLFPYPHVTLVAEIGNVMADDYLTVYTFVC